MTAFPREKLPRNPRILIIKLRSIGDVVYNTAVYSPLKKSFPDCHLTVLVEDFCYDVVRSHPDIDEVLTFEKGSFFQQSKFYFKLFTNQYDVVIDMHEGTRGAIMCFVTQARFRVGHKYAKRSFLYNVRLEFGDLNPQSPMDYQVALIKKMGVSFENIAPTIFISEAAKKTADELMKDQGFNSDEHFCIIHPGGKIYDQWYPWRFADIADRLYRQYKLKILFTCGPRQKMFVDAIIPRIKDAQYAFISTNLHELGAITKKSSFVLCHDGGYMHFAAAIGTPVVGLFGWSTPRVWKPIGDKTVVVYKNAECSPCNSKTIKEECLAGDPECKRLITVDDVFSAIKKVFP
jgi:lipopolysaccharide heptosyltransferase II